MESCEWCDKDSDAVRPYRAEDDNKLVLLDPRCAHLLRKDGFNVTLYIYEKESK